MLCSYGCNQEAKYELKNKKWCCSPKSNSCPRLREKNSIGVEQSHKDGREYTYNTNSNWTKGKTRLSDNRIAGKYSPETLFVYGEKNLGSITRKKILIKERGHRCESCNNAEWLGDPIALELEHCDGDNKNNIKENLKLLCPNCHSKTPTWRKRKAPKGRNAKCSEEEMLTAIKESSNMSQVLKKLDMKWGSSSTIVRLLMKHNIRFADVL
jgi:Zn finger protein HypA/HybF involved in hydrogenase expression